MRTLRLWVCALTIASLWGAAYAAPMTRAQALTALAQTDAKARLAGVERLAEVGVQADADRVIQRLGDVDPEVRSASAAAVWQIWSRSGDEKVDALFARGLMAGALLVGNFGDGFINAYDLTTHAFLGQVQALGGGALQIDGLWALAPGNGGNGGNSSLLYFTAGPDDESNGLFGVLTPAPEPSVALLLMTGVSGLMLRMRRRLKPTEIAAR